MTCVERQNEIEPDKIYVQMFGSFRMTYQGQQIQLGKWLSAKMIHLLLLLICRRGEGVTRSELIWRLYGADENDSQSSNSLRAMIFRLRRSIQESGLPEGEYISTKGGRIHGITSHWRQSWMWRHFKNWSRLALKKLIRCTEWSF